MKRIKSFAKINLGLEIKGKREDGYHDIRTLFQTIGFFDVLEFKPIEGEEILLEGEEGEVSWDEDNIIFKAARLLKDSFHIAQGIEIKVEKNIPPGKGLGGGSSNAAMTLYALNEIWRVGLQKQDLVELGKSLGADVPFFLQGGLCLGLERGDKLVPLPDLESLPCILVLPPFSISTPSVYGRVPLSLTSKDKDSKIIRFLENRKFGLLENSLEEIIFGSYPRLKIIKSLFQTQGSELSLVSGTGSAVFGLFTEKSQAEEAVEEFERKHSVLRLETLPRERYWQSLKIGV